MSGGILVAVYNDVGKIFAAAECESVACNGLNAPRKVDICQRAAPAESLGADTLNSVGNIKIALEFAHLEHCVGYFIELEAGGVCHGLYL